jgi:hypothetical protein
MIEIGKKVFINENSRVLLGLPDGVEYTIKDVLKDDVPYKIVLGAEEFGKDWVEFFMECELIGEDLISQTTIVDEVGNNEVIDILIHQYCDYSESDFKKTK